MQRKISLDWRIIILSAALILCLSVGGSILVRDSSKAFGGNFAPQMGAQQGGRYQISASDGNSAWIIDTAMGDVYLIYSSGKWKEVGSIMDEQKRIKK